jgi:hypothetical protein
MVRLRQYVNKIGVAFFHALCVLPIRLYALAILLVVVATGYSAVAYLMRSVFSPMQVSEQFISRHQTLDVDTLRDGRMKAAYLTAPTASPGQYHETDHRFQADLHNGCTTSGCHSPLPHTKSKEARAFVNFHATFLNCTMCHDAGAKNPLQTMWVNMADGKPQDAPELLKLINLLEVDTKTIETTPGKMHADILQLLGDAIETIGGDPVLNYLRIEIDTSEPGSPMWRHAFEQLTMELPKHARGEYGAKLSPTETADVLASRARDLKDRTDQYLSAAPGSTQREKLYQEIHSSVRAKPDACLSCHGSDQPRLDFEKIGYSPQRAAALRSTPIARLIQQMREGRPFHLPSMMEGEK